ncbi:MAG: molybdenum cofactor guanylyltransferase [Bacillota bacterium]
MGNINDQLKKRGAIILAGGDSKRLGSPKALLKFQNCTLIELIVRCLQEYFDQLTLVTDRPDLYDHLSVTLTGDLIKTDKKSPLRGIHAGLSSSLLPYQFVAACDMPFLNLDLIEHMEKFTNNYDAVVPRIGDYFQPLHAYYNRSCIEVIENQVKKGHYKVTEFYKQLNVKYIGKEEIEYFDPQQLSFININRWLDYEAALKMFSERHWGL